MKKKQLIFFIAFFSLFLSGLALNAAPYKANDTFTDTKPLVFLDFDNNKADINNLGGAWGPFDGNPNDKSAYIRTKYVKDTDLHKSGYYLKVAYSVESSLPAFNGIWTKLNDVSLKDFQGVVITIRGDSEKGYSDAFKIEIKDKSTKISATIEDITDEWKKIFVPFDEFEGDTDLIDMSKIAEFTIVFEDWKFKQKVGGYLMDDISFVPKKGMTVKLSDILPSAKNSSEKKTEK